MSLRSQVPEEDPRREDLRYIADVWRRVSAPTLLEAFGAGDLRGCLLWTAAGVWLVDAKAINAAPADQVRLVKDFLEQVLVSE